MIGDDRGVTSPIEYVLTIAIATILVTGLIVATTNHVGDQRERTIQAQMDVVGQQLAGSLETAAHLVQMDASNNPRSLSIERDLPDQLVGNGYQVTVDDDSSPQSEIRLTSAVAERPVTVAYDVGMNVHDGSGDPDDDPVLRGGTITIEYDGAGGLVVTQ